MAALASSMMKQCTLRLGLAAFSIVLASTFGLPRDASAITYSVVDLGTLGGADSAGQDLSGAGVVVGVAANGSGDYRAFRWAHPGPMMDLGTLGGSSDGFTSVDGWASAINQNGHIAGFGLKLDGSIHAFLRTGASNTDLGGSTYGTRSEAHGLHPTGGSVPNFPEVVGHVDKGLPHSFIAQPICSPGPCFYVMFDIFDDKLQGVYPHQASWAEDINSSGNVAGYWIDTSSVRRGFFYRDSPHYDLTSLPPLPGGTESAAYAINAANDVVGQARDSTGQKAVVWFGGSGPAVALPSAINASTAYDINDAGQIVGANGNSAFLFSGGALQNLDQLIDPASGWTLRIAWAINDAGQITGTGRINGQTRAFLASVCGNSIVDPGEACDEGAANGGVSCCTEYCQVRSSGTTCRTAADECDVAELCNGTAATCPADAFKTNGTLCSPDDNLCTLDVCDGSSVGCTHPAGNAGAVCRLAGGECDLDEACTGTSTACPADQFKTSGTCIADANPCTLDVCNGSGPACAHPPGNAGASCPDDGNPCTADQCNGTSAACQHPAGNAGTACPDDGNSCTLDQCNGTSAVCQHLPAPNNTGCNDGNACTSGDVCQGGVCQSGGPVNCLDGNPCTSDGCNTALGCQHTAISNCNPTDSRETQCGPAGCSLSSPNADVTVPAGCLPQTVGINIAALAGGTCPQYFDLHAAQASQLVSCTEFVPPINFICPVTMTFKWTNIGAGACDVGSASGPVREGRLRILRGGTPVAPSATSGCGTNGASLQCPTEPLLSYPCNYAADPTFCAAGSSVTCNPSANTWTLQAMHFSEYALANVCSETGPARINVGRIGVPGEESLTLRGRLVPAGTPVPAIDPAVNGVQLTLYDAGGPTFEVVIPGGALWTSSRGGLKWTYKNKAPDAPGNISKIVINAGGKKPSFMVVGKHGTFVSVTVDVAAELYFPVSDVCFTARWPQDACAVKGTPGNQSIKCK